MRRLVLVLLGLGALPAWSAGRIELTTRVPGVVEEVRVGVGQRVKKGEVLVKLNTVVYEARVKEAQAEVERSRLDEDDAKKDLDRAEELYRRTVTSTTELDAARLKYARAKAGLMAADAHLTIAQKNLTDAVLRAPFNGVVAERLAEPGMVTSECQSKTLIILSR
ncbi:MAG TPA: efflux RND transporter periplasmic adaptor subunit [Thiobacillaceae bacterium]|nr:efflux RND transporter periplasmic adaptor subunit [Thiobacillaceae bacterium]